MADKLLEIKELLNSHADFKARLNLLPYDGTPEVKNIGGQKFLYVRKRKLGKVTSTYVGKYSDELYNLLLKNNVEARSIKKNMREIEKRLVQLGYTFANLDLRVLQNIDFARLNMKANIYDQAILEGVATSFPQTSQIIDNGSIGGMTASDILKILNLKHAWEFILDRDIVASKTDYFLLCHIAKLINEGFYMDGGRIRGVPVTIGGTTYVPPLPREPDVKEDIERIVSKKVDAIDRAIELCMYVMKTQIFLDGNKRAAVIFANHFLISHGGGLIVIPEKEVGNFKKLLVAYYEGIKLETITQFMKEKCWKAF